LVGVEEVYHCAAKVSFHPKDKRKMYKTNIEGTKQLLYFGKFFGEEIPFCKFYCGS
jgi:nucleoside-diphosphate-sugar epimerase